MQFVERRVKEGSLDMREARAEIATLDAIVKIDQLLDGQDAQAPLTATRE